MTEAFYIRVRGQVRGPYSDEQLQQLIRKKQFSRLHEVSEDGKNWSRASDYPEFFQQVTVSKSLEESQQIGSGSSGNDALSLPEALANSHAVLPPAPSAKQWYYAINEEEHGPVSLMYLKTMVNSGQLGTHDVVWQEGMPEWVVVDSVPGLVAPRAVPRFEQEQWQRTEASHWRESSNPSVSGMAVASLVLGLLPFFWGVTSLLAIIFGAAALGQIKSRQGKLAGSGMAVAGLVLGIIFLVLWFFWFIAVLAEMPY